MTEEQPTSPYVYVPDLSETHELLATLIRQPKGVEHPIFIEHSTFLENKERRWLRERLERRLERNRAEIPYRLKWYSGPGLVCYWEFVDTDMASERVWFDRNAERGVYPDVRKYERNERT
ncbi:MAG: hypothetical protein ACYTEQ_01085 [Planctomycetota bacterium]|jgi:hypothetical protein